MTKKIVGQRFSDDEGKSGSDKGKPQGNKKVLKRTSSPKESGERGRPYSSRQEGGRSYSSRPEGDRPYSRRPEGDRPYSSRPEGDRPYTRRPEGDRPYSSRPEGDRPYSRRPEGDRPYSRSQEGDRPYSRRPEGDRPYSRRPDGDRDSHRGKDYPQRLGRQGSGTSSYDDAPRTLRKMYTPPPHPEGIRINRYIAAAGICSRRDADKLVESGDITVNGVVVNTLGSRIDPGDLVAYKGVPVKGEKLRYVLLNKPKGYITTNDDPEGRATVMELIAESCEERLFPVGRLDMSTTGVLLFTNDGILAEKLMHPSNVVKKLYHVKLDNPITKEHMKKITMGLRLEDGKIKADQIAYVGTVPDNTEVGLEIHSGKNRIVRRIFEFLGYNVVKLDRVMFAGLTKKDLRRGKWRHLTSEEVSYLKML